MRNFGSKTMLLALALLAVAGAAQGANISGTITSTLTITGNNQLTGNVTCGPLAVPCIFFGAANTQLKLKGFTITGDAASLNTCSFQDAIDSGYDHAKIQGPGLITGFGGEGINLGGYNSEVQQVVIISVCLHGIQIAAGGNHNVHQNSISRFSLVDDGEPYAGIYVGGTGSDQIQNNAITGAGPFTTLGVGVGIEVLGGSDHNVIKQNNTSGNSLGIWIQDVSDYGSPSVGNMVQNNQALGNLANGDIYDNNAAGANQYNQNLCQVSLGTDAPVCPGMIPGGIIGNQ